MAFSRPSLDQLISRARADVEAELGNGAAYLRRSFEAATAKVQAGLGHTLHGHLAYLAKQCVPFTAEDEFLVGWAEFFMGADARNAATHAVFDITVTGTVDGTTIPSGTQWSRGDGVVFESTADVDLSGLEATISVQAVATGVAGNTLAGTTLSITSPIVGVDAAATVGGTENQTVGGGADIESIAALKQRLLDYLQSPPKGGAAGDYVTWARQVDSVTRAWELPLQLGPSTVVVLFVQDLFDADGFYVATVFPSPAAVTAVQDYLNDRIPITVNPSFTAPSGHIDYVFAPTEVPLNPTVALSPNTAQAQTEVTHYLQDLLLRESEPGGTLPLSHIDEAISLAPSEIDHNLVSPVADIVASALQLYTLGTITFQDL